ncbi:MAG: TPM domain-containing protein [Burkholderiaceae bacterium]
MRILKQNWLRTRMGIAWCVLGLLFAGNLFAQQLQPVPPLTSRVTDLTLTLGTQGKAQLEAKLADIEARRGSQIAVLLVNTTSGEPIEDFANRVGTTWKIGRKGVGDGVLIVLAVQDRKVRIDVARTLEGAIPDVTAKRIISETMAPAFKQGDYAGGLIRAVERIDERLAKEAASGALPAPSAQGIPNPMDGGGEEGLLAIVIFGIFAGIILKKILGGFGPMLAAGGAGTFAAFAGNPLLFAIPVGLIVMIGAFVFGSSASRVGRRSYGRRDSPAIFFPSSGSGGWSGGSSGGGGWSSGGGGDFSGGGASGDW